MNRTEAEQLTTCAFERLKEMLEGYGNTLNQQHSDALYALVDSMTKMTSGDMQGRYAFGMGTGLGKTTAIIAWLSAVEELQVEGISIAVAASQVEALCRLSRAFQDAGIPEEKIGLLHSKPFNREKAQFDSDYASLPSTDHNERRPYLLVTQQRIRSGELKEFHFYNKRSRDLLVWDESLLVSNHWTLPLHAFEGTRHSLKGMLDEYPEVVEMSRYFTASLPRLKEGLHDTKHNGNSRPLQLPLVLDEQLPEWDGLVKEHKKLLPEYAAACLDFINQPVRVLPTGTGGLVRYDIAIPESITNILVLDASFPIRELARADRSIKNAEDVLPCLKDAGVKLGAQKTFEHVEIHQWIRHSGRNSMLTDFSNERQAVRSVAEVAKTIPLNEGILFFVFKPDQHSTGNYRNILLNTLEEKGIDLTETVDVQTSKGIEKKPRVNVITWGMETSLNDYAYCQNVFLVGVIHRAQLDVAGSFISQSGSLSTPLEPCEIHGLVQNELCHSIYQALSRGSCRVSEDGKARPMKAWIIHRHKEIQTTLDEVMPGAVWKEWKPTSTVPPRPGQINTVAMTIRGHLTGLSEGVERVSSRRVKRDLMLQEVAARTWAWAVKEAIKDSEWLLDGQSFVRAGVFFQTEVA